MTKKTKKSWVTDNLNSKKKLKHHKSNFFLLEILTINNKVYSKIIVKLKI